MFLKSHLRILWQRSEFRFRRTSFQLEHQLLEQLQQLLLSHQLILEPILATFISLVPFQQRQEAIQFQH